MPDGENRRRFLRGTSARAAASAVLGRRGANDRLGIACIGVGRCSRVLPHCQVEQAFQDAAPILMWVEPFQRERKVRWDAARKEIV